MQGNRQYEIGWGSVGIMQVVNTVSAKIHAKAPLPLG